MIQVRVGDKLPLTLKLYDNRTGMSIRADIFSIDGELLQSVKLREIQSGLYLNNDIPMPDLKYIIVSYTVEDSNDYESVAETFCSYPKEEDSSEWIVGMVEDVSQENSEWITGVVT